MTNSGQHEGQRSTRGPAARTANIKQMATIGIPRIASTPAHTVAQNSPKAGIKLQGMLITYLAIHTTAASNTDCRDHTDSLSNQVRSDSRSTDHDTSRRCHISWADSSRTDSSTSHCCTDSHTGCTGCSSHLSCMDYQRHTGYATSCCHNDSRSECQAIGWTAIATCAECCSNRKGC